MIETHDLSRWFGSSPAVDRLNVHIERGEVVGFLGPNGAGKSTTLRMISGYLPPTAGSASVAGFDVRRESREVRRRIGYLPESTPLYPEMRVGEYLRFRGRLYDLPFRARRTAIESVLRRCWLTDVRRKPIGHLSKGYRQRVGLAAALLHNPPVLLLDEPTSGLDPSQIREMRGLIRELAGDHTVFLSTHILPEVEVTCDRIIIIASGRIRADGRIADLVAGGAERTLYAVEVDSPAVIDRIQSIPGVLKASERGSDGRWTRFEVVSDQASDLRESIGRAVSEGGAKLRELTRQALSLEQLFIRLTSEGDGAPAGKGPLVFGGAAA